MRDIYATPRHITNIDDCYFYHTMDIPGHGLVQGDWDLRGDCRTYLAETNFSGKNVRELGPASGFLSFKMEEFGAKVVSIDLSPDLSWDIVPFFNCNMQIYASSRKEDIRKLNNGYWFAHERMKSQARVIYSSIYDTPPDIEPAEIATFGCILLHLRDPFLAMQKSLRGITETFIVCDLAPRNLIDKVNLNKHYSEEEIMNISTSHSMSFLPDPYKEKQNPYAWWEFTPQVIMKFGTTLGFGRYSIYFHKQKFKEETRTLFTVKGHRTP